MAKKSARVNKSKCLVRTGQIQHLPCSVQLLVKRLSEDPTYAGSGCKSYGNKEGVLPGQGPFIEFVAKGNKQRAVMDDSSGAIYATLDHHKSYFEVV